MEQNRKDEARSKLDNFEDIRNQLFSALDRLYLA